MRSVMYGHIKSAVKTVRNNRGRSFLTILGIVVGVVSVVSIVSIGEGVKRQIGSQINHVGKDLITVRPGKQESSTSVLKGITTNPTASGTFSTKEVEIVSKTRDVGLSAPVGIVSGRVSGGDSNPGNVAVIGTTENLLKALKEDVAFGIGHAVRAETNQLAIERAIALRIIGGYLYLHLLPGT